MGIPPPVAGVDDGQLTDPTVVATIWPPLVQDPVPGIADADTGAIPTMEAEVPGVGEAGHAPAVHTGGVGVVPPPPQLLNKAAISVIADRRISRIQPSRITFGGALQRKRIIDREIWALAQIVFRRAGYR